MRKTGFMVTKLTLERLNEVLSYDPITGIFKWKKKLAVRIKAGSIAGTVQKSGSIHIRIDNEQHKAHRLAYFIMNNGVWPEDQIKHIDGDKGNNRWSNLLPITHAENMASRTSNCNNTSGHRNISYNKHAKVWNVQVRRVTVKYNRNFKTLDEAIAYRDEVWAELAKGRVQE